MVCSGRTCMPARSRQASTIRVAATFVPRLRDALGQHRRRAALCPVGSHLPAGLHLLPMHRRRPDPPAAYLRMVRSPVEAGRSPSRTPRRHGSAPPRMVRSGRASGWCPAPACGTPGRALPGLHADRAQPVLHLALFLHGWRSARLLRRRHVDLRLVGLGGSPGHMGFFRAPLGTMFFSECGSNPIFSGASAMALPTPGGRDQSPLVFRYVTSLTSSFGSPLLHGL